MDSMVMGFLSGLQLVLVTLKLLHQINWSWWLVLMPAWLWLAWYVFLLLAIVAIAINEDPTQRSIRKVREALERERK